LFDLGPGRAPGVSKPPGQHRIRLDHPLERSRTMLWTILVILAIIALVLFIVGRARGGRRI
jgi:hypothetical protein